MSGKVKLRIINEVHVVNEKQVINNHSMLNDLIICDNKMSQKKAQIRIIKEVQVITKGKCQHNVRAYHCRKCPGKGICKHNKRRSTCKECGGKSICEHGRQRSRCKECGGSQICEHGRQRSSCKPCGGSQICEHNRMKSVCKDCGGKSICEHNDIRSRCKLCKGGSICEHNKRKSRCKDCGGGSICEHNRIKSTCKDCGGNYRCIHDRRKTLCRECKGGSICKHDKVKSKCRDCKGGSICVHNKIKYICKTCRQDLPLEESLSRYKHACVICGYRLRTKEQHDQRLCGEHIEKRLTERVEVRWRNIILHNVEFKPSTIDETIYVDCKTEKYRPDLSYQTQDLIIILELDENSHGSYDPTCELKRAVNMKDAFPNHKLLMIRMNPDSCSKLPLELENLEARTCFMIEVMNQYMKLVDELSDKVTNVIYLFYSNSGLKNIELAEANPDKINIVEKYYC